MQLNKLREKLDQQLQAAFNDGYSNGYKNKSDLHGCEGDEADAYIRGHERGQKDRAERIKKEKR